MVTRRGALASLTGVLGLGLAPEYKQGSELGWEVLRQWDLPTGSPFHCIGTSIPVLLVDSGQGITEKRIREAAATAGVTFNCAIVETLNRCGMPLADMAAQLGNGGQVPLFVTLERKGDVERVSVLTPHGYMILDTEWALRALRFCKEA